MKQKDVFLLKKKRMSRNIEHTVKNEARRSKVKKQHVYREPGKQYSSPATHVTLHATCSVFQGRNNAPSYPPLTDNDRLPDVPSDNTVYSVTPHLTPLPRFLSRFYRTFTAHQLRPVCFSARLCGMWRGAFVIAICLGGIGFPSSGLQKRLFESAPGMDPEIFKGGVLL